MARFARNTPPGSVIHIISRFVNRGRRMATDSERQAYLARVAAAARHTDWVLLAYALMSNHIHWAAVAGTAPLEDFVKPLHGGFATWLNRTHGTLGPVFADRPKSIAMSPDDGARLLAYIHNNPVRALVVSDPADSPWTSHRAYLGKAPPWLAVERGLQLCGFDASIPGRQAFHRFVCAQAGAPRDPVLSGDSLAQTRAQVRSRVGAPVELSSAHMQERDQPSHWILAPPNTPLRPRWQGPLTALLSAVAEHTGVSVEQMQSRDHTRPVAQARRLALWTGHRVLGRNLAEIAAVLGISRQAASKSLRALAPNDPSATAAAELIAQRAQTAAHLSPAPDDAEVAADLAAPGLDG